MAGASYESGSDLFDISFVSLASSLDSDKDEAMPMPTSHPGLSNRTGRPWHQHKVHCSAARVRGDQAVSSLSALSNQPIRESRGPSLTRSQSMGHSTGDCHVVPVALHSLDPDLPFLTSTSSSSHSSSWSWGSTESAKAGERINSSPKYAAPRRASSFKRALPRFSLARHRSLSAGILEQSESECDSPLGLQESSKPPSFDTFLPTCSSFTRGSRNLQIGGTWRTVEFGPPGTLRYRMLYLDESGKEVSPWHGLPLYDTEGELRFLCTTPRCSWAEYEPAGNEPFTPLKLKSTLQRNGRQSPAHFRENTQWNFGILPQTWADPDRTDGEYEGMPLVDGPLEVVDIGARVAWTGDVYAVKPLGAFALIDSRAGRLSWKIVAINAADPMAVELDDVADVHERMPGVLEEIREWLRTCRCLSPGDKENAFGLNERAAGKDEAVRVVAEGHASWQLLVDRESPPDGWGPPLVGPLEPADYEALWSEFTVNESFAHIQLSDTFSPRDWHARSDSADTYLSSETNLSNGSGSGQGMDSPLVAELDIESEVRIRAQARAKAMARALYGADFVDHSDEFDLISPRSAVSVEPPFSSQAKSRQWKLQVRPRRPAYLKISTRLPVEGVARKDPRGLSGGGSAHSQDRWSILSSPDSRDTGSEKLPDSKADGDLGVRRKGLFGLRILPARRPLEAIFGKRTDRATKRPRLQALTISYPTSPTFAGSSRMVPLAETVPAGRPSMAVEVTELFGTFDPDPVHLSPPPTPRAVPWAPPLEP